MTAMTQLTTVFAGHRFDTQVDEDFRTIQEAHLQGLSPLTDPAPLCSHRPSRISVRRDRELFTHHLAHLARVSAVTVVPFRTEPYSFAQIADVSWWRPHPGAGLPEDHLFARDAAGTVHVLLHPDADRGQRYLARVLREGVLRCAEDRGWTVFHAAAAAVAGQGILIAGESGAGKTTVLTALVAHARADLIAADRAAVTREATRVVAIPLSVRIAAPTLASLPPRWPLEARQPETSPRSASAKTALAPRAFAEAFGVSLRESAPLRAVVLPRLTDDDRPPAARVLDGQRVRAHLASVCCTPYDEDWLSPWFFERTIEAQDLDRRSTALVAALTTDLPIIRVTAGVHSHHLLEHLADTILRRLP